MLLPAVRVFSHLSCGVSRIPMVLSSQSVAVRHIILALPLVHHLSPLLVLLINSCFYILRAGVLLAAMVHV